MQDQLAKLVEAKNATISRIEAGTMNPSTNVALKLQGILKQPIEYLLRRDTGRIGNTA
jgi:DNA-binding XRE family transcriptional regulator